MILFLLLFQSTRPSRGATGGNMDQVIAFMISIHAPLAGRDWALVSTVDVEPIFQSTRPSRGATEHRYHAGLR